MKIGILANFPVGPRYNGGAMTVWGIYQAYKEKGYDIKLILLCDQNTNASIFKDCQEFLKLNKVNYEIIFFNYQKKNLFNKIKNFIISLLFQTPEYFFYEQSKLNKKVEEIFEKENFQKIICYHFDALSSCYLNNSKNIICFMGDLMHEPRSAGRLINVNNLFTRCINKLEEIISMRVTLNLLSKFKNIGFCAHHYKEKIKKKIIHTNYYRVPIINPEKIIKYETNIKNVNKILLIGDLTGTVTISSLIYLQKFLKNSNSIDKEYFEIHIFGNGKLKSSLKDLNNYKFIKFRGVSNNISDEFDNMSILLVPNDIKVGMRVRIITAISYGLVVLTHSSNLSGIPELEHNRNVLVFNSFSELDHLLAGIKNSTIDLDKISKEGINTFNKYFNYKNAVTDLENKLI